VGATLTSAPDRRSLAAMTVATQSIYTSLRYRDAMAAIEFLEQAFGFERGAVHHVWSFGTHRPE
jgi:exosortase/archaeosortase